MRKNLKEFIKWIVQEMGGERSLLTMDTCIIHSKLIELGIIESVDDAGLIWSTTKEIEAYFGNH